MPWPADWSNGDQLNATNLNGRLATIKSYIDSATGGGVLTPSVESFTGSTSSTITLAETPDVATHPFRLYKNGMYLLVGTDYTRSGTTVTLSHARTTDDIFVADYYHA